MRKAPNAPVPRSGFPGIKQDVQELWQELGSLGREVVRLPFSHKQRSKGNEVAAASPVRQKPTL